MTKLGEIFTLIKNLDKPDDFDSVISFCNKAQLLHKHGRDMDSLIYIQNLNDLEKLIKYQEKTND